MSFSNSVIFLDWVIPSPSINVNIPNTQPQTEEFPYSRKVTGMTWLHKVLLSMYSPSWCYIIKQLQTRKKSNRWRKSLFKSVTFCCSYTHLERWFLNDSLLVSFNLHIRIVDTIIMICVDVCSIVMCSKENLVISIRITCWHSDTPKI